MLASSPTRTPPMFRQVYERFRKSISDGVLKPGERVPSVRALATQLNLARGTIDNAYALLCGEGYLVSEGARGTFVNPSLPIDPIRDLLRDKAPQVPKSLPQRRWRAPFFVGLPALDLFPRAAWARLIARRARLLDPERMLYPPFAGDQRLRAALVGYLRVTRGVECHADQIVITSGFQSSLARIVETVVKRQAKAWVEDPGYWQTAQVLRSYDIEPVPAPVDSNGLNLEAALTRSPDASLCVVTPSNQFPLNVALSIERRFALLDWAKANQTWIVEDDYDSEFYYKGRSLPALKSLDSSNRVFYVGSFSKTIYPGLRIGYVVCPSELAHDVSASVRLRHGGVPALEQSVVADFIESGAFGRHVKQMRTAYQSRRLVTLRALEDRAKGHFDFSKDAAGLHLIGRMADGRDDVALIRRAAESGYRPRALSRLSQGGNGERGLVLGFTNVPEEKAAALVDDFCTTIGL